MSIPFEFGDEHVLMSRYGYTLIQSVVTGRTLVTAPMVVNNIIAFVVIQPFDDQESAFLYALTLNDAGIRPESFTEGRQSHDKTQEDDEDDEDEDDRAPIALLTRHPHQWHREPALL